MASSNPLANFYYARFRLKMVTDEKFRTMELTRIRNIYAVLKNLPDRNTDGLKMTDIAPFADFVTKKMIATKDEDLTEFRKSFMEDLIPKCVSNPIEEDIEPNGTAFANVAAVLLVWDDPVAGAEYWTEFCKPHMNF